MLQRITQLATRIVERYLPDPFVFVLLLTVVVFSLASLLTPTSPQQVLSIWGNGIWKLLAFAMQMLLILVAGHMLANAPIIARQLKRLATLLKTPSQAIIVVTLVSMAASWINWGFGLVVGALFAKTVAQYVKVDYRLLVASAYSGFVVWHAGLSGSIPLTIATEGHFSAQSIGVINTSNTLFSSFNLIILASLFVVLPLLNRLMMPKQADTIMIDPDSLKNTIEQRAPTKPVTPSEQWEQSPILGTLVGLMGLSYLLYHFIFLSGGLNLNILITLFLSLAFLFYRAPANIFDSLNKALPTTSGIVIQFPFYAGIMAVMTQTGLAHSVSQWFIELSSAHTLPLWSFLSAGLVNIFVPSGGGQWAVQAPVMIPAAQELGVDISKIAMAVAWGDAWTNLIQPFWALPLLAIAGLKAKDVMGFCLIQLIVSGVIIATLLTFL